MKNLPVIYTQIYCRIRRRIGNKTGEITISNKEFRRIVSQPLGIDKHLAKLLLSDLQRYGFVKHESKDRIILSKVTDNQKILPELQNFKKEGLI